MVSAHDGIQSQGAAAVAVAAPPALDMVICIPAAMHLHKMMQLCST
jgi:hypothetical protein